MRPEATPRETAARLNRRFAGAPAQAALAHALRDGALGRIALVSSFGAGSAVLLHMTARIAPDTPVIFLDTEMLFAETLAYQADLARRLGLSDVRRIRPDPAETAAEDPEGRLHLTAPDACCALRKARPLERALAGLDAWVTGRKRFQGGARAGLDLFEPAGDGRIKLNPLVRWSPRDMRAYLARHRLPPHPLERAGYPSLGCAPCTSPVRPGEPERAGRWRGSDKTECGIHFLDGRPARSAGDPDARKEDA